MQTYDIIMLVVMGIATFLGAIKGFAWQIASIASIVVSYFVAYNFRGDVAKVIHAQEPWNGFLAMLLLYAGSSFVIWVIFRLISNTIDQVRLRDFDRHMGALLGAGKGVLFCILITMFAVSLLGPRQQQSIINSRSGGYIAQVLSAANGIVLPKEIEPIVRPYLNGIEQKFDQRGNGQPVGPSTNDSFLGSLIGTQNNTPSSGSVFGNGSSGNPGNNPFGSALGINPNSTLPNPSTVGSWLNQFSPPNQNPVSNNLDSNNYPQMNSGYGYSAPQMPSQGQGGQSGFGSGYPASNGSGFQVPFGSPVSQPHQNGYELLP